MNELKSCPFCNCEMGVDSNRDFHKLVGDHDDLCVFAADDCTMQVPASDDQLASMIDDWNRRAIIDPPAQGEVVHPAVKESLTVEQIEAVGVTIDLLRSLLQTDR